jgi:hypothetical protein
LELWRVGSAPGDFDLLPAKVRHLKFWRYCARIFFRLGDKVIEALECLKSWAGQDLCYITGTNVVNAECMLVDLQRQAKVIAGTTEEE